MGNAIASVYEMWFSLRRDNKIEIIRSRVVLFKKNCEFFFPYNESNTGHGFLAEADQIV